MTRHLTHICRGTCSRQIDIDLDGETILNVRFTGGCHGKGTSCPDQLARALKEDKASQS